MLKEEKLLKVAEGGVVSGKGNVRKYTISGLDEMQSLTMDEQTDIEKHGHEENDQWEVWVDLVNRVAYICGKEKMHQMSNSSNKEKKLWAIKGHSDVSEVELMQFFKDLGMIVVLAK